MFLDQAMQLLMILHSKPVPNDADFGLMQALSVYIEMQVRAATHLLEVQLRSEGFTEDDIKGYTPSSL